MARRRRRRSTGGKLKRKRRMRGRGWGSVIGRIAANLPQIIDTGRSGYNLIKSIAGGGIRLRSMGGRIRRGRRMRGRGGPGARRGG